MYGRPHPLIGSNAPELKIEKWFNLKPQQKVPRLKAYSGKVVYLFCYQNWCPGCHKYGFPTLKKLTEQFKENNDIVFLAVQTVFEGFKANGVETIERTRRQYVLDIPFGHDDGDGRGSVLMKDYRSGGTPWHIIIDKQGKIVFCGFHVDPDKALELLKKILD